MKLIYSVERIQRTATKFILSLPFRSEVSYKNSLLNLNLIPLCYWHEYLDLVYIFKNMSNDSNIPINVPSRFTRRTDPSLGITLNVIRSKTVTFQNSLYCRAPRIWNILPAHLRSRNLSLPHFKREPYHYYKHLTGLYFDIDRPQTFKSICVKCYRCRPISSLGAGLCC